jgi:hypothetical protein
VKGADGGRDLAASLGGLSEVVAAGATEVSVPSSAFVAAGDPRVATRLAELVDAWRAALPAAPR